MDQYARSFHRANPQLTPLSSLPIPLGTTNPQFWRGRRVSHDHMAYTVLLKLVTLKMQLTPRHLTIGIDLQTDGLHLGLYV
jgi:hypothetical protein